jgi:hypothetical protein
MPMSAEGSRKEKNCRDLLLTHEKPVQNQVIQLSWTAMIIAVMLLTNPKTNVIIFHTCEIL